MLQFLKNTLVVILASTAIYLIINLIHLSWTIAQPEGFWGFGYFIEVFFAIVLSLIISIWLMVALVISCFKLISNFRENFNLRSFSKFLLYAFALPLIFVFNYLWGNGMSIYIDKKMSDKYKYIKKSDDYFDEGAYAEALKFSEKVYVRAKNTKPTSKFFFLSWLYSKTDFEEKRECSERYEAFLNHAYCLQFNDSLDAAKAVFMETLSLVNCKNIANNSEERIFPKLSLAQIYYDQGNLFEANNLFNEALSSTDLYDSREVEKILYTRGILASYAEVVGDYRKASNLYLANLKLYESSPLSKSSLHYLVTLLMACTSYMRSGDMNNAGDALHRAELVAELKSDKSIYLNFLSIKANYCLAAYLKGNGNEIVLEKGKWDKFIHLFSSKKSSKDRFIDEAETCQKAIIEKELKLNGEQSIQYALGLSSLADFYRYKSDFEQSRLTFSKSIKILEHHKNNNPNVYFNVLLKYSLTDIYGGGRDETIEDNLSSIQKFYLQTLSSNYLFLTEEEKETYIANVEKAISNVNTAHVIINSPNSAREVYNNILATKGIALYSNQHIRQFLSRSDTTFRSEYFRLLHLKELTERKNFSSDILKEKAINDILFKEKELVGKILKSPFYTPFELQSVKWENVRDSLGEEELAVEIINIPNGVPQNNDARYFALILSKKSPAPELIPLFDEHNLLSLLNKYGSTKNRIDSIYKNSTEIYKLVLGPIEKYLLSSKKVYFSLSGLLFKVSFSALLANKANDFEIVSSTRCIAMPKYKENLKKSIAIYGDIDYGASNSKTSTSQEQRSTFGRLKYSLEEIHSIDSICNISGHIPVYKFTGLNATKSSFLSIKDANCNIIHLATHGFFYDGLMPAIKDMTSYQIPENPLTRCCLAFAHANESRNSGISETGILTALEVSRLDLSNVDLVVLSACESGAGQIRAGEGVMGFQRAFAIAGAKNVVVSLWNISDEHTAELMKYFYAHLTKGTNTALALKQAQLDMKKKYPNAPYYWAGFMAISLN